jgi:hypothetical protein
MKYLFENEGLAIAAEQMISSNMGLVLPEHFSMVRVVNNPEHIDYNKAFIAEVEGDEYHHTLWLTGVTGYTIVEYDPDWFLPEEI